jgi:hypothetical protein
MARGEPFKYGRRTCIFCERQPPAVKITKEHVFGDWLRELFPRNSSTTHTFGSTFWPDARDSSSRVITSRQGQGHSGSKKVKHVCRDCNTGWMSRQIEDRVKPVLTALLKSDVCSLADDAQRILALWAAKTVMTSEYVSGDNPVISQVERSYLMNNLVPPTGWHVWVGSYGGQNYRELAIYQHAGTLMIPSINDPNAKAYNFELTTIGIGDAIFVIMNSNWPSLWPIVQNIVGEHGAGLSRLWPLQGNSISWPRWTILTDQDAYRFTDFFNMVGNSPIKV